MKLALLLGGEYRTFDDYFPNWYDNCLKHFDYDLFLSTWSVTSNLSDNIDHGVTFNKSEVNLERILKVTKKEPYFLNIEPPINFETRPNKGLYHWQRLLTNLINVKDQYDFVILTRPDVFFYKPINIKDFIRTCDKNKIYGPSEIRVNPASNYHRLTVHDIYFMGNPTNIINTLLPVPFIKTDHEASMSGKGMNLHAHLANYFVKNDIFIHEYGAGSIIVSSLHQEMLKCHSQ